MALTDAAELIRLYAGEPQGILARQPLLGLPAGDKLAGVDYRVSRGVSFALTASGRPDMQVGRARLHLVSLDTCQATLLGTEGDGRSLWGIAIEP